MQPAKTKSRSYRRVAKRLPGGRNTTHYEYRKPTVAHCGKCSAVLHGIPRVRTSERSTLSKTERRPERPYGGVLCSSCMRARIKEELRA